MRQLLIELIEFLIVNYEFYILDFRLLFTFAGVMEKFKLEYRIYAMTVLTLQNGRP